MSRNLTTSYFKDVLEAPEDPIMSLPIHFGADPRPEKVNLGVGSYRTSDGKPYVMNAVRKAEEELLKKKLNKEYLPLEGDPIFIAESLKLIFGSDFDPERIFACQAVGGTGALRLAADFLIKGISKHFFFPKETWSNHGPIFLASGFQASEYPYYDYVNHTVDFKGICDAINKMPANSSLLLQACCHNPTGSDFSKDQWKELSKLLFEKRIIPIFDVAYQGFGKSVEDDIWPVRMFYQEGHEMLVCVSNSKNFGLYGERIGFLALVSKEAPFAKRAGTQIKHIIRITYSNPPMHGGQIIGTILSSPELKKEWIEEIGNMRLRMDAMREALAAGLEAKSDNPAFSYIKKQKGFFSLLGFSEEETLKLRKEKALFMPYSGPIHGRINIAGLNTNNLDYVIDAILAMRP